MHKFDDFLIIIPAREGSKRLPNKNCKLLNGKPLISYTIESAIHSQFYSKIIISTDSKKIVEIAQDFNIEVNGLRPQELAQDNSKIIDVVKYELEKEEKNGRFYKNVIILQPTSPLRNNLHIDESVQLFRKTQADTLTAVKLVKEHPYYTWGKKNNFLSSFFPLRFQNLPKSKLPLIYIENGSIYIVKSNIVNCGKLYGKRVVPFIMDENHSIDVDTFNDFLLAEILLKNSNSK